MTGERVLVLGLGRFGGGVAAARFLARRGAIVRIADRSTGSDLDASRHALADLPSIDWQLGREDESLLDGVDRLVVNPAIPSAHPLLRAARTRGIACTQEVSLFLEHYPGRVVAVTGTNGKSSTSTMLHAALQRSGVDALLGGNIGHSLLDDEGRWSKDQVAVLEISSFQLDRVDPERHRVHGAVLTRIGKDHVDRHGSLEAYWRAKSVLPRLASSFCVHAADDEVATRFETQARRLVYSRSGTAPLPVEGAHLEDGWVTVRLDETPPVRVLHEDSMRVLGTFQRENALAAATAALLLGGTAHGTGLAIAGMAPLPFRLQHLATIDGVRVYDNSVSTEVDSTRSALATLTGPIHWVGGGKSKDGDYAAVANGVRPFLASAHLFGAAAGPLAACLHGVPTTVAERVPEALANAFAAAQPGSLVLFSPAFASFDQYPNFRARALEFHAIVAERRRATAASRGSPPPATARARTAEGTEA